MKIGRRQIIQFGAAGVTAAALPEFARPGGITEQLAAQKQQSDKNVTASSMLFPQVEIQDDEVTTLEELSEGIDAWICSHFDHSPIKIQKINNLCFGGRYWVCTPDDMTNEYDFTVHGSRQVFFSEASALKNFIRLKGHDCEELAGKMKDIHEEILHAHRVLSGM